MPNANALSAYAGAEKELSRLSPAKLDETWTARPAQKQVLSNVLHERVVTRAQRKAITIAMEGRPLRDLPNVVAAMIDNENLTLEDMP